MIVFKSSHLCDVTVLTLGVSSPIHESAVGSCYVCVTVVWRMLAAQLTALVYSIIYVLGSSEGCSRRLTDHC